VAWAQAERVVLTLEDLVRMADTDLPTSLIIRVIESADEVPVLQPQNVSELVAKGVPVEALEAIVARKGRTAAGTSVATEAAPAASRHVSITATLDHRKGLLEGFKKGGPEVFAVYWGAAAIDAAGSV